MSIWTVNVACELFGHKFVASYREDTKNLLIIVSQIASALLFVVILDTYIKLILKTKLLPWFPPFEIHKSWHIVINVPYIQYEMNSLGLA